MILRSPHQRNQYFRQNPHNNLTESDYLHTNEQRFCSECLRLLIFDCLNNQLFSQPYQFPCNQRFPQYLFRDIIEAIRILIFSWVAIAVVMVGIGWAIAF
jgi:hypothetical protein